MKKFNFIVTFEYNHYEYEFKTCTTSVAAAIRQAKAVEGIKDEDIISVTRD